MLKFLRVHNKTHPQKSYAVLGFIFINISEWCLFVLPACHLGHVAVTKLFPFITSHHEICFKFAWSLSDVCHVSIWGELYLQNPSHIQWAECIIHTQNRHTCLPKEPQHELYCTREKLEMACWSNKMALPTHWTRIWYFVAVCHKPLAIPAPSVCTATLSAGEEELVSPQFLKYLYIKLCTSTVSFQNCSGLR